MRTALLFFCTLIGLLSVSAAALAQEPKRTIWEEVGYLAVNRDHVPWPAPESVVTSLRSTDEDTRLKAFYLLGFTETQAHQVVWDSGKVTGKKVVTAGPIELIYSFLGEDPTQQAVLTLQIPELATTYAAVIAPASKGWLRVAAFSCWCKYDAHTGKDSLAELIQLHPVLETAATTPPHSELVLRGSGGGTGIYTQTEAHFRMHDGDLHLVVSFVSRRLSCPGTDLCALEKRWFYADWFGNNEPGGILVEGSGKFAGGEPVQWAVRDLENRHLRNLACTNFKWNERSFRYEKLTPSAGTTNPCPRADGIAK
jgi:hypothetical protein